MNKYVFIGAGLALIIAFAAGRYTCQAMKDVSKTHQDDKTTTHEKDHKVTVITQDPNGKTVTTITDDSSTVTNSDDKTDTSNVLTSTPKPVTNISVLTEVPTFKELTPTYGISVTREVLGPITVGAFALTNRTIGVSIGVNF